MHPSADRKLAVCQRWSLIVGLTATAICALCLLSGLEIFRQAASSLPTRAQEFLFAVFDRQQLFESYLLAFLFWWGIGVGALGLLMITWLVGSHWGRAVRPLLAAACGTAPLAALLFVPLALEPQVLYVWARPEAVARDAGLQHKTPYLNAPFFRVRAVGYFAIWIVGGLALAPQARGRQVEDANQAKATSPQRNWRQGASGLGLVLLVATTTLAACDWSMSLDPAWFSTIYGALIGAGAMVTAMALVVVVFAQIMPPSDESAERHDTDHTPTPVTVLADLGSLLLALVMVWAYFAFSQFLIIWSANLPAEASWYLLRLQGGWQWSALALVALHFALPFLLLLSRDAKSNSARMTAIGLLLLAIHLVALHWHVAPVFHPNFHVAWTDVVAPAAVGGLWLCLFCFLLRRRLPVEVEPTS